MPKLIVNSETKIILRVSTESEPQLFEGEDMIDVQTVPDISERGGIKYWVWNNNALRAATVKEIRKSGVADEERKVALEIMKIKLIEIINDPLVTGKVKDFFVALKKYIDFEY